MKKTLSRFWAGVMLGLAIPVIAITFVVVELWALVKRLVPPPIKRYFGNKRKEKEDAKKYYDSLSEIDQIIESTKRNRRDFLRLTMRMQLVERCVIQPAYLFMATTLMYLAFSEPRNLFADALSTSIALWLYAQTFPGVIRYAWGGQGFQMSEEDRKLDGQFEKLIELAYSAKEQEKNLEQINNIVKKRGGKEYAG